MSMKAAILFMLCIFSGALAEIPKGWPELKTVTGMSYRDVKVLNSDAGSIRISHADGVTLVPLADVSIELQNAFGYDPVKAAQLEKYRALVGKIVTSQVAKKQREAEAEERRIKYTKWLPLSIKVEDVYPDGVVGYPYAPAVPAHRNFSGDWFAASSETVDKEHPLFIADVHGFTKGQIFKGEGVKQGEIEKDGVTFPRWVLKPKTVKP